MLVSIVSFARGYTVRDMAKDYAASNKGDMKALKRAIANTTWHGGLMTGSTGTIARAARAARAARTVVGVAEQQQRRRLVAVADTPITDDDVLIKIHASTVTMGDCELRSLTLPLWTRIPMRLYMGYRKPRKFTPGMELSGVIESVGKNVVRFKKGDPVFGSGGMGMGANAEYKIQRHTSALAIKPAGPSFAEAATIAVGGLNALHFLRKANIRPGQKVLVNGAGGIANATLSGNSLRQFTLTGNTDLASTEPGPWEDVLRELRSDTRTSDIPVLVISADAGSCDRGPRPRGADQHVSLASWQRHDLEVMLVQGPARQLQVIADLAIEIVCGVFKGVDHAPVTQHVEYILDALRDGF